MSEFKKVNKVVARGRVISVGHNAYGYRSILVYIRGKERRFDNVISFVVNGLPEGTVVGDTVDIEGHIVGLVQRRRVVFSNESSESLTRHVQYIQVDKIKKTKTIMKKVFGTDGGIRYHGDSFLHVYASGVVRNVRPSKDGRYVRLSISLEDGDESYRNKKFFFYPQFSTKTRVNDLMKDIKNGTILNLICGMTSKEKEVNGSKFHYENFMIDDMEIVGYMEVEDKSEHEVATENEKVAIVEEDDLSLEANELEPEEADEME